MFSADKKVKVAASDRSESPQDAVVWPPTDKSPRIGAPLAWAIAVTAVATVFAIIAIIANYGPLNSKSQEQLVRSELPASRYDAVSALINAAGETCTKICSITPEHNLSGATHLAVACAQRSSTPSCAAPVHFVIAVSRED